MEWWDFVTLLVGKRTFDHMYCGKCGIEFNEKNYPESGMGHGIQIPYGSMISNQRPIVCERCYARFLIMVAEWFGA